MNTETSGEGEYLQDFLSTVIVLFMLEWQEVEMKQLPVLWLARRTGSTGWHCCIALHIAAHRTTTSKVPSAQTAV